MISKDFDGWNNLKKKLQARDTFPYCSRRSVWWCSIGVNIGSEEDGKNDLFERPVLVLKVFNDNMACILPLTSRMSDDKNHHPVSYLGRQNSAILSQVKTISMRRLSKKITNIDEEQFGMIRQRLVARLLE